MRHWMSAHAESIRAGQRLRARRQDLPTPPAARCLFVSAREVALRTDVRSLVARVRGSSDQTEAASAAHAGPYRAGVVHRDWLGHPDLPAVRSPHGRAVGNQILHPAGAPTAYWPGKPPTPADVAQPDTATSAVCWWEPAVPRPRRGDALPARGNGITAGASRDAGGGRGR